MVDGWMDECMDRWMGRYVNKVDGYRSTDGWIGRCMNG